MKLRSGTTTDVKVKGTKFDKDVFIKTVKEYMKKMTNINADINAEINVCILFPHLIQLEMYRIDIAHKLMNYILANCTFLHQIAQEESHWKNFILIVAKKGHELLAQINKFSARNTKWTSVQKKKFCDFSQTMNEVQVKFPLID